MVSNAQWRNEVINSTALPLKRFLFLFDLECGVATSGYVCLARDKESAIAELRKHMPEAIGHIKSIRTYH